MIEVPAIQLEGRHAAINGMQMETDAMWLGFCFNPYPQGSTESGNFQRGVERAVYTEEEQKWLT